MEGLKKSFLVRGNNIVGFSDKNFSTAPIGTVLAYAGNEAPRGYLLANGASYKVADYPNLYAVIGNTYGGDTENFNVPNLVDKFIQGSTTSGTEKEAGLPNITGEVGYLNAIDKGNYYEGINNKDGCFASSRNIRTYPEATRTAKGEADEIGETGIINFNASNSNSIYGNSNTVQPPALTMVYIIKAFHTNEGVDSGASDDVINYIDGEIAEKIDKTDIVTALDDSVTDNQVTSALLTKTELGKINDSLVDKADADKVVPKITITDTTTADAKTVIEKNWSTIPAETSAATIVTSNYGYNALINKQGKYGTVMLTVPVSGEPVYYGVLGGSGWTWKELATMDKVADVPNTVIVSEDTNVKLNSNCYYTVINGVCYVSLWGFQCTKAGQYVVNSSMPKTRLTMKGLCTYGSNGYEGGCAYVFYDGKGNNKLYVEAKTTNEPLYGSFSYPVA